MEVSEEVSVTTSETKATDSMTTIVNTDQEKVKVEQTEVTETTTTTVKTVTSTTVSSSSENGKETTSNGAKIIKITPEMSVEILKNANANSSGKTSDTAGKSDTPGEKKDDNKTIMNVQSVMSNVKPTILKVQDSDPNTPQKQTRTVLIVNRDGNKVTLAVSKQSITGDQNTPTTAVSLSQSLTNALSSVTSIGKLLNRPEFQLHDLIILAKWSLKN